MCSAGIWRMAKSIKVGAAAEAVGAPVPSDAAPSPANADTAVA
ncbi:hypothetical protein MMASJCM_4859 [Mycobacteroides abscessus subsp. massiliense CCUG 48898 = JCM 15300]|nr:hypothetical protein MMASJCM_4859 [Mycobacteroides abscessus subsp. massiliense CCUG 48898 = JCM 15300]